MDATTTDHPAAAPADVRPPLTRDEARKLTTQLRNALVKADNLLVEAFERAAPEALGYGSGLKGWKLYCDKELPALRMLRLDRSDRDAKLREYRRKGMTESALVAAFGLGAATVHRIVHDVEVEGPLRSLDGKNRSAVAAPRVKAEPVTLAPGWPPAYPSHRRVADVVAAAGAAGMSYVEVAGAIPWRDGQVSPAITRAKRKGLIRATGEFRDGCAVYVAN